ncbi:MAG: ABC transporter permease [Culicoidibacterales bacterium]
MRKQYITLIVLLSLLLIFVFGYAQIEPILARLLPTGSSLFVQRTEITALFFEHLKLVTITVSVAITIGFGIAFFEQFDESKQIRPVVQQLGTIFQSFPTVAIIALIVPVLGYGNTAVIVGVAIYGVLPIMQNTFTGFEQVSPDVLDAAKGLGMNQWQQIWQVKIPLAFPIILAGVRTAMILSISAVTLGAAAGSGGLGVPIILGLRSQNLVLILQGTIPIALMALIVDQSLRMWEQRVNRN